MEIRPLQADDVDALHELFNPLAGLIPRHYRPDREQFIEELLRKSRPEKADVIPAKSEVALVAIDRDVPVALAMGCFVAKEGAGAPARTGVVRWVLAGPNDQDATRAVVRGVVEKLRAFEPTSIVALIEPFAPPFYGEGVGRLTSAWPWLAHWLTLEHFAPRTSKLRLWRMIDDQVLPAPLPEGLEIQAVKPGPNRAGDEFAVTRTATLDGAVVGSATAWFGEEFVRAVGKGALFIEQLDVDEPHRQRGIGRALLRGLLVDAQSAGATEATILVNPTDFAAQTLLRTEGFVPIDVLWDFELK